MNFLKCLPVLAAILFSIPVFAADTIEAKTNLAMEAEQAADYAASLQEGWFPFYPLIQLNSFWAWFLIGSTILVVFACSENDHYGWANSVMLALLAVLVCFGSVNLVAWAFLNPMRITTGIVAYVIVGIVFTVFYWYFYVINNRTKYNNIKREFLDDKGITGDEIPDTLKRDWLGVLAGDRINDHVDINKVKKELRMPLVYSSEYSNRKVVVNPAARYHKAMLLAAVEFWPGKLFWMLLDDFVKRFYNFLYNCMINMLDSISNKLWGDLKNDIT